MKRLLGVGFLGVALLGAAFASAAALPTESNLHLQGATIDNLECQQSDVGLRWGAEMDNMTVSFVRLTNIDAACEGSSAIVQVQLAGGGSTSPQNISGTLVEGGGPSLNQFSFAAVPIEDVDGIHIKFQSP